MPDSGFKYSQLHSRLILYDTSVNIIMTDGTSSDSQCFLQRSLPVENILAEGVLLESSQWGEVVLARIKKGSDPDSIAV